MTPVPQSDDQRPQWANELFSQYQNLNDKIDRFNEKLETDQKASDRVANLAFTVVTASAAVVVLAPAVKIIAEYLTR
jgi:Mlc titration factor MtfA (ptsG expression regulator)